MPLPALLLPAAANFAPALLNKIFGGASPEEKLRHQLMALLAPEHQQMLQNQFYQQAISSPAYSQAQGTIAAGANATGANLARAAGNVGPSGTGALLSSVLPSIVGGQQAGLRTGAYNSAQQQAAQTLQQQLSALTGTANLGPSRTQQFVGAGIEGFAPFLTAFLKQKYPMSLGGDNSYGAFLKERGGNLPVQSLLAAANP